MHFVDFFIINVNLSTIAMATISLAILDMRSIFELDVFVDLVNLQ